MEFFQNLQLSYSRALVCFCDRDPFFKVTGIFFPKICLEPVDRFHLTRDSYIVRTSQSGIKSL